MKSEAESTAQKRILYFLDEGQGFGGAVNTLLLQAILMKRKGHAVAACFSSRRGSSLLPAYQRMCEENGIQIFRLPYTISSYTEGINIVAVLEDYASIRDAILQFSPDILHSVQINTTVELASRELNIPHIMNIYPALPSFFSLKYMDVFPKYMICDSLYWAKVWQAGLAIEATCIRTVVLNPSLRDAVRKKTTRYICVGSIYAGKNQLEVIRAFHLLISTGINASLDIYGSDGGSYAESCKDYVRKNLLERYVTFQGYCEDMQSAYKNADALIVGSIRESYPNVVSEALANSVIVISTPVGGVPEVVKDSYNGYLPTGFTGEEICKKLIQFEQDKKTGAANKILKNANDTYFSEHSEASVYAKLYACYEDVQERAGGREACSVMLSGLEEKFSAILGLYKAAKNNFTKVDCAAQMLWYFFHVMPEVKALPSDSKIYIWGAGKYGLYAKENLKAFFPFLTLSSYIDSKHDGMLEGISIRRPETILADEKSIVFIGLINGQWDVISILESYGKVCHKTYFFLVQRSW